LTITGPIVGVRAKSRLLSLRRESSGAHRLVGLGCDRPGGGERRAIRRLYDTERRQYPLGSGSDYSPLRSGERDEEHQFGVTIPYRGWVLDVANFQTNAQNFFDHSCIGSGLCLPITIDGAKIRGWELTLRSPPLLTADKSTLRTPIKLQKANCQSRGA
jgi:hypothetical protein